MTREVVATLHVASRSSRDSWEVQLFAMNLEMFARGAEEAVDVRESRYEWAIRCQRKSGHDTVDGMTGPRCGGVSPSEPL